MPASLLLPLQPSPFLLNFCPVVGRAHSKWSSGTCSFILGAVPLEVPGYTCKVCQDTTHISCTAPFPGDGAKQGCYVRLEKSYHQVSSTSLWLFSYKTLSHL